MKRKVLSLVLVAGMVSALLAGCGGTEASSNGGDAAATDTSAAAEDGEDAEEVAEASDVDFGGTEITIKMCNTGCVTDANDRVVDAINAITEEKLGITVNVEWIGIADYGQQMNLLFSSQEACDIIMTTPVLPYAAMKNQDELMDISEYLEEYGQDILATAPTLVGAYTDGDAIYGVPVYRQKGSYYWWNIRTDLLEEVGMVEKAENCSSWTEFEEICAALKEANPDMDPYYVCPNNNVATFYDGTYYTADEDWSNATGIDNLGDSNYLVYVDDNGQVQSYYTSDLFKNSIDRAKQVYETGYVNDDAATVAEDGVVQIKNQVAASCFGGGEIDNETTQETNSGYDVTAVKVADGVTGSFVACMWGFAVPYTSENPDAAVAFLNEMYTNTDLANLFVYGEEGVDWELNEDGYAQYVDGATSSEYHTATWLTPNAQALTPWAGSMSHDELQEAIDNEVYSDYLGFFADTSNIEQEVTSCVNVVNEYRNALVAGVAGDNTDAMYSEMCEKLSAAGIDKIVAEYQTQLDEWVAAQ